MSDHLFKQIALCFLSIVVILSACKEDVVIVPDSFKPNNHHEAYQHQLETTGIAETTLGKEWIEGSKQALTHPTVIETPFAEEFYQDERSIKSVGYRLAALRGHKVTIDIAPGLESEETTLFLQVFRVVSDSLQQYEHIASNSDTLNFLEFEPQNDDDYIIRFQTEILRGGRFNIKVKSIPALAFPVSGKDKAAIGSLFGVPRDAGRRKHHGIDIFARRHTPIVAPCDGYVRSTKENELGGKVVWFNDTEREQTIYFAHLQDVFVAEDQKVEKGDTIGTVGNSGNAKTTACHLHFGIYKNGPIDPYHFVVKPRTRFKRTLSKNEYIGTIARTNKATQLKVNSILRKSPKRSIPENQIVNVLGTSGAYYKVELPDYTLGYLAYTDIEKTNRKIKGVIKATSKDLYVTPLDKSLVLSTLENTSNIKILGKHDKYYYVSQENQTGWVLSE